MFRLCLWRLGFIIGQFGLFWRGVLSRFFYYVCIELKLNNMKKLLFALPLFLFSCNQKSDNLIMMERIQEKSHNLNMEYQRHLKREISLIIAYGDNPNERVLDSMRNLDSMYSKKLNRMYFLIDSIAHEPTSTKP